MKKKYIAGFLLLLLPLLCILVFPGLNKPNKMKEDVTLKDAIIKTVEKSNQIDFANLTDFEWDKMYIFTPYSIPKDLLNKDGIKTSNSNFTIEVSDTINMIGFVKSNQLVAFVELPRSFGGMNLAHYIKFNKEETKFSISKEKKMILFK